MRWLSTTVLIRLVWNLLEFNDSILADEESERQQDRQDVSMGVMSLVEYRMKWYNEDEATAKSKIPEQNRVME